MAQQQDFDVLAAKGEIVDLDQRLQQAEAADIAASLGGDAPVEEIVQDNAPVALGETFPPVAEEIVQAPEAAARDAAMDDQAVDIIRNLEELKAEAPGAEIAEIQKIQDLVAQLQGFADAQHALAGTHLEIAGKRRDMAGANADAIVTELTADARAMMEHAQKRLQAAEADTGIATEERKQIGLMLESAQEIANLIDAKMTADHKVRDAKINNIEHETAIDEAGVRAAAQRVWTRQDVETQTAVKALQNQTAQLRAQLGLADVRAQLAHKDRVAAAIADAAAEAEIAQGVAAQAGKTAQAAGSLSKALSATARSGKSSAELSEAVHYGMSVIHDNIVDYNAMRSPVSRMAKSVSRAIGGGLLTAGAAGAEIVTLAHFSSPELSMSTDGVAVSAAEGMIDQFQHVAQTPVAGLVARLSTVVMAGYLAHTLPKEQKLSRRALGALSTTIALTSVIGLVNDQIEALDARGHMQHVQAQQTLIAGIQSRIDGNEAHIGAADQAMKDDIVTQADKNAYNDAASARFAYKAGEEKSALLETRAQLQNELNAAQVDLQKIMSGEIDTGVATDQQVLGMIDREQLKSVTQTGEFISYAGVMLTSLLVGSIGAAKARDGVRGLAGITDTRMNDLSKAGRFGADRHMLAKKLETLGEESAFRNYLVAIVGEKYGANSRQAKMVAGMSLTSLHALIVEQIKRVGVKPIAQQKPIAPPANANPAPLPAAA